MVGPCLTDVYYLVPLPPSPLANGIMGLAGIFCFGLLIQRTYR